MSACVHVCLYVQIVLETNTRNKKKMITTVTGLEQFGIKLQDAAKGFGKKFACGSSVTKSATGTDQIDMLPLVWIYHPVSLIQAH
jgi:density-regulated protein DRP1